MLAKKNIVLAVSGSIAAYKAVYLARLCVETGAHVWPVLTNAATRFIGPLSLSAVCGHEAIVDMWSPNHAGAISHVELAHRADLFVLAPATADTLARLAQGRADDAVSAIALATRAPIIVAPAMETGMWEHSATQQNVATLQSRGVTVVAPTNGRLASGRDGLGRMAEPESIMEAVYAAMSPHELQGERVLVTAGATREHFDPVRFVSNASTGKMGYALARSCHRRGAEVHLISGPTTLETPTNVQITRVTTAQQMLEACREHLAQTTLVLMAAAPSDFRPRDLQHNKIKKATEPGAGSAWTVPFVATPDILRSLQPRPEDCLVVGFAAESGDPLPYAREKLLQKQLDMIVANDITQPGAGFAVDTNRVTIIHRDGTAHALPLLAKEAVADAIVEHVIALRLQRPRGRG